jgi:2-methylcitrate dehydratase PrpD
MLRETLTLPINISHGGNTTMPSLSRELAGWVTRLRYEDLPPEVVDRAKGVTLHCISSILLGSQTSAGKQAVKLVTDEESGVRNGATILVDGRKVTRAGAAFANSEMAYSGGKWDTFKMLTHPGTSILPCALVGAEGAQASGKDFLVAIAAAYEVAERLGADFIPTVMSRGFHPGPVFGIFGAGVAAGKLAGLTEDQMNSVIALCASLAGTSVEGPRTGGKVLREGAAVRNAMLAKATPVSITRTPAATKACSPTASKARRKAISAQSRATSERAGPFCRRCTASTRSPATTSPTSM